MTRSARVVLLALALGAVMPPPALAQWAALGLSGRQVNKLRIHGGVLYACTDAGLYRLSTATADSIWTLVGFDAEDVRDLLPLAPQALLLARALSTAPGDTVSLFRSTDGGGSWQPFQNGFGAGGSHSAHEVVGLARLADGTLLGASHRVERSLNGGLTWAVVAQSCVLNPIETSPAASQVVWAGGESCIFWPVVLTSNDAGATWKQPTIFAGGDNAVDAIAFHPINPLVAYLGMEGRVMKTEDGGASFSTVTSPDPSLYTFGLAIRSYLPLRIYAAGSSFAPDPRGVVVYESQSGGASWTPISHAAAAGHGVRHLLLRAGSERETLYVATGNGVFRLAHSTVGVAPPGPLGPGLRVHPNPVSGEATIHFTLAQAGFVRLEILDVSGRRVELLLAERRPAGAHGVRWNAGRARAGVFLCRLQTSRGASSVRIPRLR